MRHCSFRHAMLVGALAIGCDTQESNPEDLAGTPSSDTPSEEGVSVRSPQTGAVVTPIARVSFPGGARVDFFEETPGNLTVVQWGPNMATPPVDRSLQLENLSPVDLYARLSGQRAPDALIAAQARRDLAATVKTGDRPSRGNSKEGWMTSAPQMLSRPGNGVGYASSAPGVEEKKQAVRYFDCVGSMSYDEWFNCRFCDSGAGTYDITWMWVTGSGSFTRTDKTHTWSTVSVFGGDTVHFKNEKRPWYSWSTTLDTFVKNGFWAQREEPYSYTDYDVRSSVDQAAGDSYHWCAYGWF